jgi:DtxR family Mn-dependent transcriptional regulator
MGKKGLSENIEEYLEVLYKYGDKNHYVSTTKISKSLNIAPGSVTQMLKKLEATGYINYMPYKGAILSDVGFKIAQKITRKHRILERFLSDVLNIKKENVHDQACDMEHSLSDEAERAMCHILEHPDICPGDKLIPACDFDFTTCEECLNKDVYDIEEIGVRSNNLVSVAQLHNDEEAEVSFIRGDAKVLRELISRGIAIGTNLIVIKSITPEKNNVSVNINSSIVNLSKDIANNIFVKVID